MLLLRTSRGVDPGIPLLRSLGSNAHVWIPGASGVSVASLPSNNYLLSNGSTGYSGVDAVDGLTLDALNGGASTQTARFTAAVSEHFYTVKGANTLLAGDIEIICQAALTNWQTASQSFASSDNLAGNYGFLFYIDASGYPAFRYSPDGNAVREATCSTKFSTVFSAGANGYIRTTYNSVTGDTKFYTAPDGTTWTQLGATVTLTAGTVFNGTGGIAVGAQFSGTTIAIAGSIARVRVYRDLVGTIAVDFNPASYMLGSTSWVSAVGETWTFGGSTISTILPSGTHLTQATTANKPLVRRGMLNELLNSATPATQSVTCIAAPYTLALIGTGNVVLSGTGAGTLTGTGASDLVVLNFTPTAGSVTFTKAGTVSSFGLFKGTWTAAQILAEGGIPTTTATAASNPSAGKYWWSLDGSNDSLLSGNLGITNACTIVIAGVVNKLSVAFLFTETTNGVNLYYDASGTLIFAKDGVGQLVNKPAAIAAGVPFVITARLSGGTAVLRVNGVQVASAATALAFSAVTGARIGTYFNGTSNPANCSLGWVVPIAAALSDADCLTVEQLAAAQFPGLTTPDGDALALLLEDGSGFLTMETGDLLLLE